MSYVRIGSADGAQRGSDAEHNNEGLEEGSKTLRQTPRSLPDHPGEICGLAIEKAIAADPAAREAWINRQLTLEEATDDIDERNEDTVPEAAGA